jgi:hypothetical protein
LARKNILIADPVAQNMNATQWLFELEGIALADERKYDDIHSLVKIGRRTLIDLLGLNIMPVSDDTIDNLGNVITTLRRPEDTEVTPLAILCGNETMLSKVYEMHEELAKQDEIEKKIDEGKIVEMTPEALDEFMQGDGDIDFLDGDISLMEKKLKWRSQENRDILSAMVKPLESKDDHLKTPVPVLISKAKKSKVRLDG